MIKHNQPWITSEDIASVEDVLKTNWLAQGDQIKKLEETFSNQFKSGHSCAVSSGSAALFLALKHLGATKNSKVVVPTYACSALLNAVYMVGATPIIVDVQEENLCIDPTQVAINAKDAGFVIAVHTYGALAPAQKLKKKNRILIEDCCQCLGATGLKSLSNGISNASVFSFYATKIVTGGQGGLIWSQDSNLIASIKDYREFDCRDEYIPRFNFQMTDIQAALVNSQMKRLENINKRRHFIANLYASSLNSGLHTQIGPMHEEGIPYRFVIKASDRSTRDSLKYHMSKYNISCAVPIERHELLHRYLKEDPSKFPIAEKIVDTTLSIPIHAGLDQSNIEHISNTLKSFYP